MGATSKEVKTIQAVENRCSEGGENNCGISARRKEWGVIWSPSPSTHLKWFCTENDGRPILHAQRETNKRKFYLNHISMILPLEMRKEFPDLPLQIWQKPMDLHPGNSSKDTKELCSCSPANNLEASFIVVSLWCYKSGTTSAAGRQNWIMNN